jgi:hypothetical protein
MYKKGIEGFPYYLGVTSLGEVAKRTDRVCVLNILGGESRQVTPVSHAFSGGNVVFGTSPGRRGQMLETPIGDIPVYNNVREGLDDGLSFNTGVVYLPPSGVRDGVSFLLEQFKDADLKDPTDRKHGLDLKAMATRFAESYKEEKSQSKESGLEGPRALPGVHHPIFKGKPVNYDPRERFIAEFMDKRGDYNVFHAFYRELVQALYETGATRYVFCVNVDAVIAALLLAILWKDYRLGALTEKDLETAAFNVFLYGRMIGAAAEIDDHLNRGRNMDTRTPQEKCAFVV